MKKDLAVALAHPGGEQPPVEEWSAIADTFGGRVHVEWDAAEPVTPLGQLAFFIEYLKQGGLFDGWVADCPLSFTSPNAPTQARRARHAAAVGSRRSSALCAHYGAALRPGEPALARHAQGGERRCGAPRVSEDRRNRGPGLVADASRLLPCRHCCKSPGSSMPTRRSSRCT